ncbi:MAG: serine/threonine-protein kinase [Gemmatimonadota bacterium]
MTAPRPDTLAFSQALDGQYQLEREIGRGGMGIVYLAQDLKLVRPVAIKTLPYHLASDPLIRERFLREARTAAGLAHPNIVPIHRADELGDFVFFVMGYVDGPSMAQRVRESGPYRPADLIPLLIDIASALGYAHVRGVVHRDVKAENILLDAAGRRAMVTDFGIARLAQSASLTQTGTVLGTVHYMSPEQVVGEPLDGRSDLYAFGVLAFFALTGRFPFESETPSAVLVAHVTRPAPPIRSIAPTIPPALAEIVDRLLAKDRDDRFDDAESLVATLREAGRGIPDSVPAASSVVLSSDEANAVWERAALLQEMTGQLTPPPNLPSHPAARPAVSDTSGYRMDDVRLAARDAGIGEKYVERALAERSLAGPDADTTGVVRPGVAMQAPINPLAGARSKIEFEAAVPGELSDLDLEDVADEIRRSVGEFGNVSTIGRSVTWTAYASQSSHRKLQLSVSARNGRTTIRGFEDLSQTAGGIFGGITGGAGGGIGAASIGITMAVTNGAFLVAAPVFAAVVASAYGVARLLFGRVSRNRERQLRTAVERVALRVRECIDARESMRSTDPRRLRR